MEKIMVTVDADLAELIPGFLENRNRDVRQLLEGSSAGNLWKI